jgi:hypothetical protein
VERKVLDGKQAFEIELNLLIQNNIVTICKFLFWAVRQHVAEVSTKAIFIISEEKNNVPINAFPD